MLEQVRCIVSRGTFLEDSIGMAAILVVLMVGLALPGMA